MGLTLTVKKWKETRPSSAKDSGVAEAIAGTLKDCSKPVASMTVDQVAAALTAVNALDKGLKTALEKMASDKGKDAAKATPLIKGWRTECADYQQELAGRSYKIKVDLVSNKFNETFATAKQDFDEAYAAAKAARLSVASGKAAPLDKVILNWMGQVRTMSAMTSKGFVPKMDGIPEAKLVKPEDVPLPTGVKEVKPRIIELTAWCTEFAKAAKKGARAAAAGVGDSTAADKELKGIMADYQTVESKMKALIQKATALAADAQALADEVKREIGKGNSDAKLFKRIGGDIKRMAKEESDFTDEVKNINISWREAGGDIAERAAALKKIEGYDEKRHSPIILQRMQANMMGIRRATLPLGEASKQIDRAKRLMQGSNNHRGYL